MHTMTSYWPKAQDIKQEQTKRTQPPQTRKHKTAHPNNPGQTTPKHTRPSNESNSQPHKPPERRVHAMAQSTSRIGLYNMYKWAATNQQAPQQTGRRLGAVPERAATPNCPRKTVLRFNQAGPYADAPTPTSPSLSRQDAAWAPYSEEPTRQTARTGLYCKGKPQRRTHNYKKSVPKVLSLCSV